MQVLLYIGFYNFFSMVGSLEEMIHGTILQIYKKTAEEKVDSPRMHKKPLFASLSSSNKDTSKDSSKAVSKSGTFSKDTTVKIMNEKFAKQVCIYFTYKNKIELS